MAGRIPDCKEEDRVKVLANMEETFVENLKFAAERLKQVSLLFIHHYYFVHIGRLSKL